MPLVGPGTFDSFFGDALDGDVVFSWLNGGILDSDHFFGTVTVKGQAGLEMKGSRLFCRRLIVDSSSLDLPARGAIHCNGQDGSGTLGGAGGWSGFFGSGGTGGTGGKAAAAPAVGTDAGNGAVPNGPSLGGASGAGGVGLSGANGKGATPVAVTPPYQRMSFFSATTGMFPTPAGLVIPTGGAGGGGGGRIDGTTPRDGGGGGGGGGVVFVCAREIILTGDHPHFCARAGQGGDADHVVGAGGGGGGGGGAIILVYVSLKGTLIVNVDGGAGGAGINPGGEGQKGNVLVYPL
jgi:hypothetical protein